jgi:hypothetical protein
LITSPSLPLLFTSYFVSRSSCSSWISRSWKLKCWGIWKSSVGLEGSIVTVCFHIIGPWLIVLVTSHSIWIFTSSIRSKNWSSLFVNLEGGSIWQSLVSDISLLDSEILEILSPCLPFFFSSNNSADLLTEL